MMCTVCFIYGTGQIRVNISVICGQGRVESEVKVAMPRFLNNNHL